MSRSQRGVVLLASLHRLPADEVEDEHPDHHPEETEADSSWYEVSRVLRTPGSGVVPVSQPRDGHPLDGDGGGVEPPGGVVTL